MNRFSVFAGELTMTRHDVRLIDHDDIIILEWSIPPVYYSQALIEQCSDDVTTDTTCLQHDVTSNHSGSLIVSRQGGTSLRFVVYQDRDEVVRLPFRQSGNSKKNSGLSSFLESRTK